MLRSTIYNVWNQQPQSSQFLMLKAAGWNFQSEISHNTDHMQKIAICLTALTYV